WGAAESKAKELTDKYGARFQQVQEDAARVKEAVDAAWGTASSEHKSMVEMLDKMDKGGSLKPELIESNEAWHKRQAEAWKGSSHEAELAAWATADKVYKDKLMNADVEKKAEEFYKLAEE